MIDQKRKAMQQLITLDAQLIDTEKKIDLDSGLGDSGTGLRFISFTLTNK